METELNELNERQAEAMAAKMELPAFTLRQQTDLAERIAERNSRYIAALMIGSGISAFHGFWRAEYKRLMAGERFRKFIEAHSLQWDQSRGKYLGYFPKGTKIPRI